MAELDVERLRKAGWKVTDEGDVWHVNRSIDAFILKGAEPEAVASFTAFLDRQRAALERAAAETFCGATLAMPDGVIETCELLVGHEGSHDSGDVAWSREPHPHG